MRAGVLALQGAFREHEERFAALGVEPREVRLPADLEGIDMLVMPGGESTTIGAQARELGLIEPIRELIASGLPVWGTCAGMILLACHVEGQHAHLGMLDISVARNGYGRQAQSFEAKLQVPAFDCQPAAEGRSNTEPFPGVFIRAPRITATGPSVEVLSRLDGVPVAVRCGSILATSFHPELTADTRFHEYFLAFQAQA